MNRACAEAAAPEANKLKLTQHGLPAQRHFAPSEQPDGIRKYIRSPSFTPDRPGDAEDVGTADLGVYGPESRPSLPETESGHNR